MTADRQYTRAMYFRERHKHLLEDVAINNKHQIRVNNVVRRSQVSARGSGGWLQRYRAAASTAPCTSSGKPRASKLFDLPSV